MPDPFAEPVDLPWTDEDEQQPEGSLEILTVSDEGPVVRVGFWTQITKLITPGTARLAAKALVAAADKAESGQS